MGREEQRISMVDGYFGWWWMESEDLSKVAEYTQPSSSRPGIPVHKAHIHDTP